MNENNLNQNQMGTLPGISVVTPPAQLIGNVLGAEAIEAIGKYAIEANEKKYRVPFEWSQKFFINREEGKTYIYKENGTKRGALVEFFDAIIEAVIEIFYSPQLYFENGKLLIFTINKEQNMLFVSNKDWGKKEMLQLLRNHGIAFRIYRSPSLILSSLMDYMAELKVTKYIKLDPRAGWVRCSKGKKEALYPELIGASISSEIEYKWSFQRADKWLFDIPAIAKNKTLLQEKYELEELESAFQWEQPNGKQSIFILLLSILFVGITFSRLREICKLVQEKFIMINSSSKKVLQILRLFFSFYVEDEMKILTLSMSSKELIKILTQSKDQLLVIDADVEDISNRRKKI